MGDCALRYGTDMASTTMTDDTSFSMKAGIFKRRAIVYTRRKIIAPSTTPISRFKIPPRPIIVPPMSSAERSMVTIPVPRFMSRAF